MKASVTRPSGDKEKCIVNKINNYQYCIKFLPIEVGIHKVEVREYDTPIPGLSILLISMLYSYAECRNRI